MMWNMMWKDTILGMKNKCDKCCAKCKKARTCKKNCCNQNKFDCKDCSHN